MLLRTASPEATDRFQEYLGKEAVKSTGGSRSTPMNQGDAPATIEVYGNWVATTHSMMVLLMSFSRLRIAFGNFRNEEDQEICRGDDRCRSGVGDAFSCCRPNSPEVIAKVRVSA
jgi:hypothetical protein